MTKFPNKFKKPCFWPIFGPFSPFFGQKDFLKKFGPVTHNKIWASNNMLSFRKNYWANPKKTFGWKDGRTDRWTLIQRTLPAIAGGPKKERKEKECNWKAFCVTYKCKKLANNDNWKAFCIKGKHKK